MRHIINIIFVSRRQNKPPMIHGWRMICVVLVLLFGCGYGGGRSYKSETDKQEERKLLIEKIRTLKPNCDEWDAAARAVVRMGAPAAPDLIALAAHEDEEIQELAIYLLGQIGSEAASAKAFLLDKINENNTGNSILRVTGRALEALRCVAGDHEAVAAIKRRLQREMNSPSTPEEDRHHNILDLIELLREAGPEAIPELLALMDSPGKEYEERVCSQLCEIDECPATLIPLFTQLLQDPISNIMKRSIAIDMLAKCGPLAREAVPLVVEQLKDDELHEAAALALWRIDPKAMAALYDKVDIEKYHLISALQWVHERSKEFAAPVALKLLSHPDSKVRKAAAMSIGVMKVTGGLPAMIALFEQGKTDRFMLARAFEFIGPKAAPAVPCLLHALGEPATPDDQRAKFLEALAEIRPSAKRVLSAFVKDLEHPVWKVRVNAIHGLWSLGKEAAPARAALEERLKDDNSTVRIAASRTLAKLDGKDGSGNGIRTIWSLHPSLLNGTVYDRGVLNVAGIDMLVVPTKTKIDRGEKGKEAVLYMEKYHQWAGHPNVPTGPQEMRNEMGCAWKKKGKTLILATFGEWDSRIEGGAGMELRIAVPPGITVRKELELSGPNSLANKALGRQPAVSWNVIPNIPDEESALKAEATETAQ